MGKVCGNCQEGDFLGKEFIRKGKLTKYFCHDICKECEPILAEKYRDIIYAKLNIKKRGNTMSVMSGLTPIRGTESKSLTQR